MAATRRTVGDLLLTLLLLACGSGNGRADGGTVRLAERVGSYQVTVFTSPQYLRAGPVDISVLVQEPATGAPIRDAVVRVEVSALGRSGPTITSLATYEAATNKLYQAAKFDLPESGQWEVRVQIDGVHGPAETSFPVDAAEPLPRWLDLWFWIALPVVPIVLFGANEILTRRRVRASAPNHGAKNATSFRPAEGGAGGKPVA
jgi:hypothetical protein